jgi:predicted ATP-dependent endonuclease of OLD family
VDFHLHPAAQQTLVPQLKRLFPNVQFLCSAHSPLVVASLFPDEIFFLRRNAGVGIEASRPDASLAGLRVDQVLTGPAFGLKSTLGPETQMLRER